MILLRRLPDSFLLKPSRRSFVSDMAAPFLQHLRPQGLSKAFYTCRVGSDVFVVFQGEVQAEHADPFAFEHLPEIWRFEVFVFAELLSDKDEAPDVVLPNRSPEYFDSSISRVQYGGTGLVVAVKVGVVILRVCD